MDYYTAAQVAEKIGLPFYLVQRAAANGTLPAQQHTSPRTCDPDNPCHLEPGTRGHHYAITLADAERWANLRNHPTNIRKGAIHTGFQNARTEVEHLFATADSCSNLSEAIQTWLDSTCDECHVDFSSEP